MSRLLVRWSQTKQSRARQRKPDPGQERQPDARRKAILESGNGRLVDARQSLQVHLAKHVGLASGSNTHAYALQRIGERGIHRFARARAKYVRFAPVLFTHGLIAHNGD